MDGLSRVSSFASWTVWQYGSAPTAQSRLEALFTEMRQNPESWQCKSVATTHRTQYIPSSVTQHNMNELTYCAIRSIHRCISELRVHSALQPVYFV